MANVIGWTCSGLDLELRGTVRGAYQEWAHIRIATMTKAGGELSLPNKTGIVTAQDGKAITIAYNHDGQRFNVAATLQERRHK